MSDCGKIWKSHAVTFYMQNWSGSHLVLKEGRGVVGHHGRRLPPHGSHSLDEREEFLEGEILELVPTLQSHLRKMRPTLILSGLWDEMGALGPS